MEKFPQHSETSQEGAPKGNLQILDTLDVPKVSLIERFINLVMFCYM